MPSLIYAILVCFPTEADESDVLEGNELIILRVIIIILKFLICIMNIIIITLSAKLTKCYFNF